MPRSSSRRMSEESSASGVSSLAILPMKSMTSFDGGRDGNTRKPSTRMSDLVKGRNSNLGGPPGMRESRSGPLAQRESTLGVPSSSGNRRGSLQRVNVAWNEEHVDTLVPEDLGVAFAQRAAPPRETSSSRNLLPSRKGHLLQQELLQVFPQAKQAKEGLTKSSSVMNLSLAQTRWQNSSFLKKMNSREVPFSSNELAAHYVDRILQVLALISCAYVMGALAIEPACVPPSAGSAMERLVTSEWGSTAFFVLMHAVSALVYAILATANRLLFGRVDPAKGEEVMALGDIFTRDVRSLGLWLDIASFAGFAAEVVHLGEAPAGSFPTGAQWVMLLQLGKSWRVLLPGQIHSRVKSQSLLGGVAWLLFSMAFIAHSASSVLLTVGLWESSQGETSWTDSLLVGRDITCSEVYIEAFYFAALSLTSVGYGDVLVTPIERGINSVFLLFSQLFTAKVCADLTWLTSMHNHWEAEHQAERAQCWESLRNMQVPQALSERVLAYKSYMANVHREDLGQPLFAGLSSNLTKELRLCLYRKLVLQAPFLMEQPKEVISMIVGALQDQVYLPADFIVRLGDTGREFYFVRRGSAAVYVTPEAPSWGDSGQVAQYVAGNYFGELAMLTGRPRAAWIMATAYCVTSVLPYEAVEQLMQEFPSAFTMLVQSMITVYKLKSSSKWSDVVTRMQDKYELSTMEEAFCWLCQQGEDPEEEEELSAKAFEEGMRRLKVPHLDRKIFWAELDLDRSGSVTMYEFAEKMPITSPDASAARRSYRAQTRVDTGDSIISGLPTMFGSENNTPLAREMNQLRNMVKRRSTAGSDNVVRDASRKIHATIECIAVPAVAERLFAQAEAGPWSLDSPLSPVSPGMQPMSPVQSSWLSDRESYESTRPPPRPTTPSQANRLMPVISRQGSTDFSSGGDSPRRPSALKPPRPSQLSALPLPDSVGLEAYLQDLVEGADKIRQAAEAIKDVLSRARAGQNEKPDFQMASDRPQVTFDAVDTNIDELES